MGLAIPEHDFTMRWNLGSDEVLWMIKPESVTEVGCIHTGQGLEVDYVGVIIGPDLMIRDGEVVTDSFKRASDAPSTYGKTINEYHPSESKKQLDKIVKNTYGTLMSRGMKVKFTEWIKKRLSISDP